MTTHHGIPVTTPELTLIDLAARLRPGPLEAAINEAVKLRLIDLETLRARLDGAPPRRGNGRLRSVVDRRTFRMTDSELERRFLRLVRKARVPLPLTGEKVNGWKVDFYWPDLGLVVETDGGTFHATPAQQAHDRQRDHAHAAAGMTPMRFTHAQVRFEAGYVGATLFRVIRLLRTRLE